METTKVPDYIESTQQQWDEEYRSKVWDYLTDITEYARYSVVYGYIRKFLGEEGILDMGCGTGILFDMLLDEEKEGYLGVDLSQEAINMAAAKMTKDIFRCGDINQYIEYSRFLTPNGVIVSSLYSHKNTQDPSFAMIERKIEEIEQCGYFDIVDKVSLFNHNAGLKWYLHLLKK
ncbi:class I SAM-dependent methyltransferase [Paenibacillus melissococcoides]|uniref:Class I SAM-dependent methyltransferase n=1 Tax=Paenibacillus melissococcoides TaxID=2912268 RepID=A0ABM9G4W2_9BACL|nr:MULTISPECIES: class I SAM-dependent methyltransferase [Paenibacillus]MEB9896632.1 class I SAM-dependent methyltransferase [Bacillus cereus]CAH8246391.1 class I SAM-dependent methyltransferase [Paenibacillus melissococcoides]CAH8714604.1 class I SAM-dependent methyltransferase [Paenibacillus melissococcoides]CAH8715560.1 class I SAM-dependent methyltransferase [Paenibacillus melissococcoides]GIO78158.1 hypothetical protein J6TS7_17680 [Paenibacillus dendritiformis]